MKVIAKAYEKLRLRYSERFNNYREYDNRIRKLQHSHLGERCFIIGTGPSIKNTNLNLLKNEILFGVNKLYEGTYNIKPQYWVVADTILFDSVFPNLLKLDTILFLTDGAGQHYLKYKKMYMNYCSREPIITRPLSDMKSTMEFSNDMLEGVNGGMVTLSALQIAYYMGFKEVYLVGCDCQSKTVHFYDGEKMVTVGDDWNVLFKTYEVCKKVYEDNGRKIYNSTVGGNLEVFERVKLEDVI